MSDAASPSVGSALFPVFLRLTGRRVLLVGGGRVAASKLQALLDAGARVTVVAPEVTAEIDTAAARSVDAIAVHRRPFVSSDLDGVWFVVAAATKDVNREVAEAAEARAIFVNAVDDAPNATAYLGGVVRRDGVTIAISTDGRAPALAGLLREGLDALLPRDLDCWMQEARAIRAQWIADRVPMEERRPLLLRRLNELYARHGGAASTEADAMKDAREPALAGAHVREQRVGEQER